MTAVQTCVNILPDIMARNPQNLARDEATASNNGRGFFYPNGISHVSLYQTGPSRDYNRGSSWNRIKGQQYCRGNSGRRDTQARYPDSFQNVSQPQLPADSSSIILDQSMHDQGNAAQWSAPSDFVQEEAVEMSRWASQGSFQSAHGSTRGVDIHSQDSSHLPQSLSQVSFPLLPGNPGFQANTNGADLYAGNSTHFEDFIVNEDENNVLFSTAEPFGNGAFEPSNGSHQRTPVSEDFRFDLFNAGSEEISFTPAINGTSALVPSTVSEASFSTSSLLSDHPSGWEATMSYPDSARSSPHFTNEPWSGVTLLASSSPREDTTSDLKSMSPRNSRKLPDTYEESSHLARQSVEMDNMARDHPLYQNPPLGPDGLYHCPWENEASCQHKGEKLKCNYDKFVDSHLKPYRCKVPQCENARFSSTACLLRHEREAHAMHGHGDKPFLCTHEGCERGVPGNGFPRHWNLRDHMKRVHNDTGPVPRSNASGSPTPSNAAPTRAPRKRKNDTLAGDKEKEPVSNKRAQTASVAASSPRPPTSQQNIVSEEPSLVQQWQQRRMHLLQLVQRLDDPRDPSVLQVLATAGKELQVLAGTSKRICNAPAMKRTESQQSGE